VTADPVKQLDDGLDPVGLLGAQLAGSAHDRLPASVTCRHREDRQLVDERGHLRGQDRRSDEPDARTSTSPAGSPPIERRL
jgi:hypothetical protein